MSFKVAPHKVSYLSYVSAPVKFTSVFSSVEIPGKVDYTYRCGGSLEQLLCAEKRG